MSSNRFSTLPTLIRDLCSWPCPSAGPDFELVQPLRGAPDDELQIVSARIPHRRVEVADESVVVAVRGVVDGGGIHGDSGHFVGVRLREPDGDNVHLAWGLEGSSGINLTVPGGMELDVFERLLRFGEFSAYALNVHGALRRTRLPGSLAWSTVSWILVRRGCIGSAVGFPRLGES